MCVLVGVTFLAKMHRAGVQLECGIRNALKFQFDSMDCHQHNSDRCEKKETTVKMDDSDLVFSLFNA